MLCIALLGFVMLEGASPAHAVTADNSCAIVTTQSNGTAAGAEASNESERSSPATPGQSAHHCCAAHCSSIAPLVAEHSFVRTAVAAPVSRTSGLVPASASDSLERPPKARAIV